MTHSDKTERKVSSERVSEELRDAIAAIIAGNVDESRFYNAPVFQRAATEVILALRSSVKTVGVKKLEWSHPAPPTDGVSYYDHCLAVSAIGEYRIEWKSWKRYDGFCVYGPLEFFESENTLDAAKAAAQSDYEQRILSSIEAPAAASEGTEDGDEERRIDALRVSAFHTNAEEDRLAYFEACSKWFQDRHYRRIAALKGDHS